MNMKHFNIYLMKSHKICNFYLFFIFLFCLFIFQLVSVKNMHEMKQDMMCEENKEKVFLLLVIVKL